MSQVETNNWIKEGGFAWQAETVGKLINWAYVDQMDKLLKEFRRKKMPKGLIDNTSRLISAARKGEAGFCPECKKAISAETVNWHPQATHCGGYKCTAKTQAQTTLLLTNTPDQCPREKTV